MFGSYNYLFHFFLLCNSNFHPKNTLFVLVLIQVRQRDRSRSPVSLRDDLLFCLTCAHSLLSAQMGLITTEWELNSRPCRNRTSILTKKINKKIIKNRSRLQFVDQDEFDFCLWKTESRVVVVKTRCRGRAVSSQDISILLFHQMKRLALTIPHTHITLRATLSGRPVPAAVVALRSTTGFTTTSQNRVRWW